MTLGPGKYDQLCTMVREATASDAAIVMVMNGRYGSGFSMQALDDVDGNKVAAILEDIASQIRADYARKDAHNG